MASRMMLWSAQHPHTQSTSLKGVVSQEWYDKANLRTDINKTGADSCDANTDPSRHQNKYMMRKKALGKFLEKKKIIVYRICI